MSRKTRNRINWKLLAHRALRLLFVLLLVAGTLVLCRTLVNKLFLLNYANENYADYPEKLLLPMAFGDNYVVPCNVGNAAYQREDYAQAERYFTSALRGHPPEEEKECAVRVNLALSMLHQFPFDTLDTQDKQAVDAALETLYSSRAVLTENGCACEEADAWTGHSAEAEALKRDIDEMIRKLTAPPPQSDDNQPPDPENGNASGDPSADPPPDDPPQEEQQEQQNQQEQSAQSQEMLQQSLEQDLKEQKQNLETGNYGNNNNISFTYIDTGETLGFGEGMQW